MGGISDGCFPYPEGWRESPDRIPDLSVQDGKTRNRGFMMYTILIVDDSPFIIDIFSAMLGKGRYRTISASGGRECLDILEKGIRPDLILLDIMMEPPDGWETLVRIKADPRTATIPVMMITAKDLTPGEAEEYGSWIEDFLQKPITHRELLGAIGDFFARTRQIEEDLRDASAAGLPDGMRTEYRELSRRAIGSRRLIFLLEQADPAARRKGREPSRTITRMKEELDRDERRLSEIRACIASEAGNHP
jgi:two-component system OmpR family response regulator